MFKAEKTAVFMKMFPSPINIDVDTVPEDFQMEVIDMQNNTDLKNVFFSVNIENFYKFCVGPEKFLAVDEKCEANDVSVRKYVCLRTIILNHRSRLNDARIKSCVRVAQYAYLFNSG